MSDLLIYIDYIGTVVFAVTGASIAGKSKFDFFGMFFLAFLTAVGGGTVRDLVISQPVFWTIDPTYLYLIFVATLSSFLLSKVSFSKLPLLQFLDALGVGAFVVIGTQKTLELSYNAETAVVMGTISAVLGGILRSAFSKEHSILQNRELYATVAGAASIIYVVLHSFKFDTNCLAIALIVITILLRYASIKYRIRLPAAPQ